MPKKGYKQSLEHKKKLQKNLIFFKIGGDPRSRNPILPKGVKDRTRYFRNTDLKRKFGITINDFELMLTKQDGRCSICGGYQIKGRNFAVDHNHTTGKVRGLLCVNCNAGLGFMKDNKQILQNAIDYLSSHECLGSRSSDIKD